MASEQPPSASDFIGGGGSGLSSSGSTAAPAAPHAIEEPAPIKTLQPPASSPGSDDPSGGIPEGSGGLSSTAAIGSPVQSENQTVVGSVLEYAFGKKERTAEEVDTQQTGTTATTGSEAAAKGQENSGTVLGAIAGVAAAGTAAVASVIPGMAAKQGTTEDATASSTQSDANNLSEKAAAAGESVKQTANETAQSASETAEKTAAAASETAQNTAAAASETANKTAETAKEKADEAGEAVKESNEGEGKKDKRDPAKRTNPDAIPTAGGERVGEEHEVSIMYLPGRFAEAWQGESKFIPENPKPEDADAPITGDEGKDKST